MNIDAAARYIRTHGDVLDNAKLSQTLQEPFDKDEVLEGFSELQNPDGGFPYMDRKGFPSCLSNTSMALRNLTQIGLVDSDQTSRAVQFLLDRRSPEGSWEENSKIAPLEPPFWDMPGDTRTTTWLTADISDVLIRSGLADDEVLNKAAEFLKKGQAPDGRFRGFINATWIAVAVFGKHGLNDWRVWQDALSYLETENTEGWEATGITWCLDCLTQGGVDTSSEFWSGLYERLSSLQLEDGSWDSADGERLRAGITNSALAISKIKGISL